MNIANSKFRLTTDENGNQRPCEYFQHFGISESKARKQIRNHKVRRNIAADEVPPDALTIKHIDNGIETAEKFVHPFTDFIIFTESRDLIAIQESQKIISF